MSDCRFGVSPVNYPDPDPELTYENFGGKLTRKLIVVNINKLPFLSFLPAIKLTK